MPWNRPLMIGLLAVVLSMAWWRLQPTEQDVHRSQLLMGTVVEIIATGDQIDTLNTAVDDAFREMERLEKLLSSHISESDVARLSRSSTGDRVAAETAEILALGLEVARRSNGAFDMTLGRLKALWGFDLENPALPAPDAIRAALVGSGPAALSLSGRQVYKEAEQVQIDLGGIAKGYAVDAAIKILKERGIDSAAINAGGDIYLLGQHGKRPWRIGIQHPRQPESVLTTVQLNDRAVVTSGDYERFFEQDGLRYHHIFDPQTGMPARACQSVTVITDSVTLGDALATAIFVLGPEQGLKLLHSYPQAEALIVASDGSLHNSPGWAEYQPAQ